MAPWRCGIRGCRGVSGGIEAVLVHQYRDHDPHECAVCGALVHAGYFAIRHAFEKHSRAEFVRFYEGSSDDIREREGLVDDIESRIDVDTLVEQLEREGGDTKVPADG